MKTSIGAKTYVFPTPVMLVGTYDRKGRPNLMAAAWGGVCCSKPPCVCIALRRATYTYGSLVERKAFTLGFASREQVADVDTIGTCSGRSEDKFELLGWTPRKAEHVDAPYADEVPLVLECELVHTLELGLHTLFVGEVKDALAEDGILDADGQIDVLALKPIAYAPIVRSYHAVGGSLGSSFTLGKQRGG
ncbi:MAG: flavin reductase family protein [Deltaproteobacteria bacterium]|nr:flavin reductase family protein [Deltaproteobacteria bacterium]